MKTFGNVLLTILTLVLAAMLCLTSLFAAASASVRATFTPETVCHIFSDLDYASLELPDGKGGFAPLSAILNDTLGGTDVSLSPDELNNAVHVFSVDAVLTSFAQDLRTWLLDDGPIPALDSQDMANTVISGVNSNFVTLLRIFGDPVQMLAELLDRALSSVKLDERLKPLEPVREILSKETLIFASSACAVLFLLILLCRRLKFFRALIWAGCACTVSGSILTFAEPLAQPFKNRLLAQYSLPESTIDLAYRPLMDGLHHGGGILAVAGLAVAAVAGIIVLIGGVIRRKRRKEEERFAGVEEHPLPQEPFIRG